MPRFTRFVAFTSLLLVAVYFLFPRSAELNAQGSLGTVSTKTKEIIEDLSGPDAAKSPTSSLRPEETPKSLRDQLLAIYPYDKQSIFPSFIWQTWKSTPSEANFEFREAEASWTERHAGYIHEVRINPPFRTRSTIAISNNLKGHHRRCSCATDKTSLRQGARRPRGL